MQTISLPWRADADGRAFVVLLRRIWSSAARQAYAGARASDGTWLGQKALRHAVKARHAGGACDAWLLHCATLFGLEKRRLVPDGTMVFGGRSDLERREKGLISNAEWREKRLLPLESRGDKTFQGNRHFRLSEDARVCTLRVYGREIVLRLPEMRGVAGRLLRQVAALAAAKAINVMFRLDGERLHVTFDPADLPDHPERRVPVAAQTCRCVGVDLNPAWIGIAAIENRGDPLSLADTRVLDHALIRLDVERDAPREQVRETLAAACDRIVAMARSVGAASICLENGLGKLRSGGPNRALNGAINGWARSVLFAMLRRKAGLAGIDVTLRWAGHSTTIGNLVFPLPDACASAAEIGRRGIAPLAKGKGVLPIVDGAWLGSRWKDSPLRVEGDGIAETLRHVGAWRDVHRIVKTAQAVRRDRVGYRRPHPVGPTGADVRTGRATTVVTPCGHAVRRLGLRRRPGTVFRPVGTGAGPCGAIPNTGQVDARNGCAINPV